MLNRFENKIISLIKLTPLVTLFIFLVIITYVLSKQNEDFFLKEKIKINNNYIQTQKSIVKHEVDVVYDLISFEKRNFEEKLKENLKNRVYEAHQMAQTLYNLNKDKPLEQKKQIIMQALKSISFNKNRGYYFIYDSKGITLLDDKKVQIKEDSKKLFKDLKLVLSNKNEAFSSWFWTKAKSNSDEKYKKIGFIKKFEKFDWIIGTGEYVQDFEEEIKKDVLKRVSQIKYDKKGYVFIIDYKGNYLNHIRKDLVNKNLYDLKDENGVFITQEIIKAAKSKQAFVEYVSILGTSVRNSLDKISYIRGLDDWQWAIGSGFHPDLVDTTIEEKNSELLEIYEATKTKIYLTILIVTLIMILALMFFSNKIESLFEKYKNRNKMFQGKLRELLSQKSQVLNSSLDTIDKYVSITRTDTNGIITFVTKNFCEDVGFTKKELLGKNHNIVRHPQTDPLIFKELWDTIKKGKVYKNILKNKTKSGGEIWFDIIIQPEYDKNREIIGYTAVRKNITDKKVIEELNSRLELKIEDAIKKNRQKDSILAQQSKMAAIGEMLENIAHQWRQPLSMISTAASGLQLQKEFDLLDEKVFQDSISVIISNTQYLSETIESFRDFFNTSNIIEPMNIKDVVNKAKSISKYEDNNLITIHENIEDIDFLGYKNELLQVLINILNNSSDAFKENKDITKKHVFIDIVKKDTKIIISIKDNAGGIASDIIEKVFEPYFTTKHQYVGTGIGLYMCMEIITKIMHGEIFVQNSNYTFENEQYTGALFKIQIPLNPKKDILNSIKKELFDLSCFKWDESKGMFIKAKFCTKKDLSKNLDKITTYLNSKGIDYKILDNQNIILDVNKI